MKSKVFKSFGVFLLVFVMLVTPLSGALAADYAAVTNAPQSEHITRGHFAALISEALGLEADLGAVQFLDVPGGHDFYQGILSGRANGVVEGDSTGNFFPDRLITGAEASVILNNIIGFDGSLVPQVSGLNIPHWALPSVSVLLDLTMVERALVEKAQLTMDDVDTYISALMLALIIPQGTEYALRQAALQDDFFAYQNRRFLATGTFNPGAMIAAAFNDASFRVTMQQEQLLADILSNPNPSPGSDEWNILQLYRMFMNNEARTASVSELDPYFDAIRAADSIDELLAVARRYSDYFNIMPFYTLSFTRDARVDASTWAAFITAASLDLGARDFYMDDPSLAHIHEAYINYLAALLAYLGETENLQDRAAAIFEIEQARAMRTLPSEAMVDPQAIFVSTTWDEVLEASSVTNSITFRDDLFTLAQGMNVYSPDLDYIRFIQTLYVEENLEALRDIALIRVLSSLSFVLGDDLSQLGEELQIAMFGGVGGERPSLELRAQSFVTSLMWRTFSNLYYQRFSSQAIKDDVTDMVEDIRETMRGMIGNLTWMSEETQEKAIEKLDAVRAFVAFPDEPIQELISYVPEYGTSSLIELSFEFARMQTQLTFEMLQGPALIDIWDSIPTSTVNAFYSGMDNAIIIPAGILQYPFYDPNAPREHNLGGIGAVIAHEFTHAFDPMGSQFDKVGTMTNWWTEADHASFEELTGRVAATISAIEFAGMNLNGAFSAGEAIADLGAMEAVLAVAAQDPDADLGLVMQAWSAIWAARMTPEVSQFLALNSPHLPMMLRVNFILAQLTEFYEVFGITPGDGMYIPIEQRLSFWY